MSFMRPPWLTLYIIPWWEWIQEVVDVWDPIEKALPRSRFKDLRKDLLSGALGVGPQPEILGQVGLGAAVLAAAIARGRHGTEDDLEHMIESAAVTLPKVAAHFAGLLGDELKNGLASAKRLLEVATRLQDVEHL